MEYLDNYMLRELVCYASSLDRIKMMLDKDKSMNDLYPNMNCIEFMYLAENRYFLQEIEEMVLSPRIIKIIFSLCDEDMCSICPVHTYNSKTRLMEKLVAIYCTKYHKLPSKRMIRDDRKYGEYIGYGVGFSGNREMITMTLKQIQNIKFIPYYLMGACAGGHLSIVQELFGMIACDNKLMTDCITRACRYDRRSVIKFLITKSQNIDYDFVLPYACAGGNMKTFLYVLQRCKNVNVVDSFYSACIHDNLQIISYILSDKSICKDGIITPKLVEKLYRRNHFHVLKMLMKWMISDIDITVNHISSLDRNLTFFVDDDMTAWYGFILVDSCGKNQVHRDNMNLYVLLLEEYIKCKDMFGEKLNEHYFQYKTMSVLVCRERIDLIEIIITKYPELAVYAIIAALYFPTEHKYSIIKMILCIVPKRIENMYKLMSMYLSMPYGIRIGNCANGGRCMIQNKTISEMVMEVFEVLDIDYNKMLDAICMIHIEVNQLKPVVPILQYIINKQTQKLDANLERSIDSGHKLKNKLSELIINSGKIDLNANLKKYCSQQDCVPWIIRSLIHAGANNIIESGLGMRRYRKSLTKFMFQMIEKK